MKKNILKGIFKLLVFLLIAVPLSNSCKRGSSRTQGAPEGISFKVDTKQAAIPLYPEKADSPQLRLTIDLLYLTEPLRQLSEELLYNGAVPDVYKDQLIDSYKEQYLAVGDLPQEYPDLSLNWEYIETINLDTPLPNIIVVSRTRDSYSGGAHGNQEKQYFVIDRGKQKQLLLKDVIRTEDFPVLNRYLESELRVFSNIEPDAPLSEGGFFEDEVAIPENFFLTSEGLGFHWNQYEIAPYVMGPIEVLLPYRGVRNLLGDPIKNLLDP